MNDQAYVDGYMYKQAGPGLIRRGAQGAWNYLKSPTGRRATQQAEKLQAPVRKAEEAQRKAQIALARQAAYDKTFGKVKDPITSIHTDPTASPITPPKTLLFGARRNLRNAADTAKQGLDEAMQGLSGYDPKPAKELTETAARNKGITDTIRTGLGTKGKIGIGTTAAFGAKGVYNKFQDRADKKRREERLKNAPY
jgi:hypothetical protein